MNGFGRLWFEAVQCTIHEALTVVKPEFSGWTTSAAPALADARPARTCTVASGTVDASLPLASAWHVRQYTKQELDFLDGVVMDQADTQQAPPIFQPQALSDG